MVAAVRKPVASAKRKASTATNDRLEPAKKKSPLFNQPQNFYAPPTISSMSSDELSDWRKEQRRKRNRESAAASRNKTRAKIEELEGEVAQWKHMYQDLEAKMHCMERHVQFLTKLNSITPYQEDGQRRAVAAPPSSPPTVVSHPNSPPRSPSPTDCPPASLPVPNDVTSSVSFPFAHLPDDVARLFPPLFSESQDCTQVEAMKAATDEAESNEEQRKHLNSIPRQAVKITGATNSDSSADRLEQQQPSGLPEFDPLVEDEMVGRVGDIVSGLVGVESTNEVISEKQTEVVGAISTEHSASITDSTTDGDIIPGLSDDTDLLDLLMDNLDGEFDPDFLI